MKEADKEMFKIISWGIVFLMGAIVLCVTLIAFGIAVFYHAMKLFGIPL